MLATALLLGALIGLTLGALGGGGSILTVPVLVYVLDQSAQEATTGSLVIVGIASLIASAGHARSGHTQWSTGLALAAAGVPAAFVGTALNREVDPDVLLLAFAAVMLLAATGMLLRALGPDHGPAPETGPGSLAVRTRRQTATRLVLAGLGIGLLTGFLGVGGGFVIVPVLVVLLRTDTHLAVGTSLLVISLNSAVALVARAPDVPADWSVVVPFTLAAVVGSFGGQRVADRLPQKVLTEAFAGLLVVVALCVGTEAALGLL